MEKKMMKIKNNYFHLIIFGVLFFPILGKSQKTGLQLIHNLKPKKYVILDKKRLLKIKYFSDGERIELKGYFDNKTEHILKIHQKKRAIYNPSSMRFTEEPDLYHRILIDDIQYISPHQKTISSFTAVIGFCILTYSTLMTAAAFSKKRPDLRPIFLKVGLIGIGISLPMVLLNKRKKYYLSKDSWEIK